MELLVNVLQVSTAKDYCLIKSNSRKIRGIQDTFRYCNTLNYPRVCFFSKSNELGLVRIVAAFARNSKTTITGEYV